MRRALGLACFCTAFASSAFAEAPLIGFQHEHRPNQYIVHLKEGISSARSVFRDAGVRPVHAFDSANAYLVETDGQRSAQSLEALQRNPDVAAIEANRIFRLFKEPNDPRFGSQYHHQKIASAKAWELATGSKDVVVAVIDSGVNYKHPDIAPNYWQNPGESGLDAQGKDKTKNGVDDDGNGYVDDFRGWDFVGNDNDPMDDHGHGTHCAGVIGAKGNNAVGVTGINWDVNVVGLKFIDGKTGEGDTFGAVAAIEYATKLGIPITSNSWGGEPELTEDEGQEDLLGKAIEAAGEKGYLFVAASGNSRGNNDKNPVLPAGYPYEHVLAVAASNNFDWFAFYSNYGATTVDIVAPGSGIMSTVLGSGFQSMSGTSMAAPVVAGAAALLKAVHPDWTGVQIKEKLMATVDVTSSFKSKVLSGGRLNLGRALTE